MKVRCENCRKKISVDDGFAGSVCRCPYCKALNDVPDSSGRRASAARPDAPPMRQAETTGGPGSPTPVTEEDIPLASPIKVQGIVSIVLICAILAMIVGIVLIFVRFAGSGEQPTTPVTPVTPSTPMTPVTLVTPVTPVTSSTPAVEPEEVSPPVAIEGRQTAAGVEIDTPVIYCIDGGSGMENTFDFAGKMTMVSVDSLKAGALFNVLVLNEDRGDRWLSEGYSTSDEAGKRKLESFVSDYIPGGSSDLVAGLGKLLDKAEAMKAKDPKKQLKVVVVFTRKLLAGQQLEAAEKLAKRAGQMNVRIVTIAMSQSDEVAAGMKKLAELTGGESRSFGLEALEDWLSRESMKE